MPRSSQSTKALTQKALRGDRRAIAQIISMTENDPNERMKILSWIYWKAGKAHVVGVTGPPGCGKSTLIAQLAKTYRKAGKYVGVVAVDPSSQVTGGALLGDRIRMSELSSDSGVFIRSMATRGQSGGLARATEDAIRILSATTFDPIIVETAGAGQSDVDVSRLVETTIVVMAPGLGDEIQALKAGIMEIGDIFVVNKADRDNADRALQEIRSIIMMGEPRGGWRPIALKTCAVSGEGVSELADAIALHSDHIRSEKKTRIHDDTRPANELLAAVRRFFEDVTLKEIAASPEFRKMVKAIGERRIDPYSAARRLISQGKRLDRLKGDV